MWVRAGIAVVGVGALGLAGVTFWPAGESGTDPLELAVASTPAPSPELPLDLPPAAVPSRRQTPPPRAQRPAVPARPELRPPRTTTPAPSSATPPPRVFVPPTGQRVDLAERADAPTIERPPAINFRPEGSRIEPLPEDRVPPYVPPTPDELDRRARRADPPSETLGLLSGGGAERRRAPEPAGTREPALSAEAEEPQSFPSLVLESVVWHPSSSRRRATLVLDGARAEDVREGDIVSGVAVDRIEPGFVSFRIGETLRRVALGQ